MSFFRKREAIAPAAKPKTSIVLVEYLWPESGVKHWDVRLNGRSITDDYGYKSMDEARAAYVRQRAIERGELNVGLQTYIVEQTFV